MRYCLPNLEKFPLSSLQDAKLAETYILENERDIPLEYRREFSKNLSSYQKEVGVPVHEKVAHYSSSTLNKEAFESSVISRELLSPGAEKDIRAILDSTGDPDKVLEAIINYDRNNSISEYWDTKLPNPVLGIMKTAEEDNPTIYQLDGDLATSTQIKRVAQNRITDLRNIFSPQWVDSFIKDPIPVFESLTDYEKTMIMRMARDEGV